MIIKDYKLLSDVIAELKRLDYRIGFTNGVFDLYHSSHAKFFKEAKNYVDVLVVAINSDESTKRIKGLQRPILSEEERLTILDSIKYVDIVTVMKEDEPSHLLEILRPHIFIKGGSEYRDISKFPEAETLKKYNINFIWIEEKPLHTTAIISRILERYGCNHG